MRRLPAVLVALTAAAALALLASPATAAGTRTFKVSPDSVRAGQQVKVYAKRLSFPRVRSYLPRREVAKPPPAGDGVAGGGGGRRRAAGVGRPDPSTPPASRPERSVAAGSFKEDAVSRPVGGQTGHGGGAPPPVAPPTTVPPAEPTPVARVRVPPVEARVTPPAVLGGTCPRCARGHARGARRAACWVDSRPPATATIPLDGKGMVEVAEAEKTEKITVNLGLVDLGQVDLLVQEGFYANRTDFIRTAIRAQLATHAEAVHHTVARKTLVLGVQHYSRRDLEAVRDAGQRLQIRVLGLASIAEDVPPDLALATIESVEVLGALRASAPVKAALAGRIV
jgi:Arc/MetJ-type ribon-helix-helix transcriptional regulator